MADSRAISTAEKRKSTTTFILGSGGDGYTSQDSNNGSTSSRISSDTTPKKSTSQDLSASMILDPAQPESPTSRGRTRHKRRQPSRRYFTPPSRVPSPVRPDFVLEVETMPQEPDIFADPETDYFSSAEKPEGPRAFRRHFFDALPSIDSQAAVNHQSVQSIDALLAGSK